MSKCIWYLSKYVAIPSNNGVGSRGYLLMKELAKLGHKPVIITSDANHLTDTPKLDKSYLSQEVDGIDLWWIRTFKYQVAKSLKRIFSWVHFEWRLLLMPKAQLPKPDIIIISSLSLLTILNGLFLSKRYQCRWVFEVRDIWPLTLTEEGNFKAFNPVIMLLGFIEHLGYKHADIIVGTMPNLKEHVANKLGYTKQVACIPMGVDDRFHQDTQALLDSYIEDYIPKGKFIVVHAGTIGITNALETFLDCANSLAANENIHFLIVGDGALRSYYIKKYNYLSNLTFAPKVHKKMVNSVLEECDLLYFSVHKSSVWNYGQSLNKVIDYMLASKPIVASYTGYHSMLNEAECGTFVPAGDVTALRDEIVYYSQLSGFERLSIGSRGRKWVLLNRAYSKLAENYLDVLFPKGY